MEYITIKKAAINWKLSERRIRKLIQDGRIRGAKKIGNVWEIPESTERPEDKRFKSNIKENKIIKFVFGNKNYFEDFITRSTYHSNAIEGNTLTYAETYALLFNDNKFIIDKKTPREIYEAINHKKAMELVLDRINSDFSDLTLGFIKDLGIKINENISDINGFRTVQVIILGSEHIPPKPEKVLNLMNYFIANYNNDVSDNIFEKIARYHIEYESIHPFQDGNGRTGRLLINYELIKNNFAPAVIDVKNRAKYYELLRTKNVKDFAKWLEELSNQELERMNVMGYN